MLSLEEVFRAVRESVEKSTWAFGIMEVLCCWVCKQVSLGGLPSG